MSGGSFWTSFGVRFGGAGSNLDELLERADFTLEELLDHDDVIQECKYMNSTLIEYLSERDVVENLIRYVVTVPENRETVAQALTITSPIASNTPSSPFANATNENNNNNAATNTTNTGTTTDAETPSTGSTTTSTDDSTATASTTTPSDSTITDAASSTTAGAVSSTATTATSTPTPVTPAASDAPKHNTHKYPYIASELFACEVPAMLDSIFVTDANDNLPILDLLLGFLNQPHPLDPAIASYFRKVMVVLVQRKYNELVKYFTAHHTIDKVIDHIGLYSMMELLIMMGWDDGLGQTNDVEWLYREDIVPKLIAKLAPAYEFETDVHMNAARALVDVVVKCPPTGHNLLVLNLQATSTLEQIFHHMFSGCMSSMNNSMSIIIVLVQRYANRKIELSAEEKLNEANSPNSINNTSTEGNAGTPTSTSTTAEGKTDGDAATTTSTDSSATPSSPSATPTTSSTDATTTATPATPASTTTTTASTTPTCDEEPLKSLLPHLHKLIDLFRTAVPPETPAQFGRFVPFGETRMKVVELSLVLFRSRSDAIDQEMIRLGVVTTLLEMFFLYSWNNMLHGLVESIIRSMLEGESMPLKKALFIQANLVDKFIAAYAKNEESCKRGAGFREGYMGHLLRTATVIEESFAKKPYMGFASESIARDTLLGDKQQAWSEFYTQKIEKDNEIQKIAAPFVSSEEDLLDSLQFDLTSGAGGGGGHGGANAGVSGTLLLGAHGTTHHSGDGGDDDTSYNFGEDGDGDGNGGDGLGYDYGESRDADDNWATGGGGGGGGGNGSNANNLSNAFGNNSNNNNNNRGGGGNGDDWGDFTANFGEGAEQGFSPNHTANSPTGAADANASGTQQQQQRKDGNDDDDDYSRKAPHSLSHAGTASSIARQLLEFTISQHDDDSDEGDDELVVTGGDDEFNPNFNNNANANNNTATASASSTSTSTSTSTATTTTGATAPTGDSNWSASFDDPIDGSTKSS